MDAGFLNVVEIGQYFMTKDTANSHNSQIQWPVVSTLFQEKKKHHNQKVGFEGTQKMGPYWKLRPATCKVNMEVEIRIESMNKDNSHSLVRFSQIDGEPMEFEWNIFPGFTTLQLGHKVQELLLRLSVTPEKFTGRIIFKSMFNDISWRSKDNKKNASQMLNSFLSSQKRFGAGQWSCSRAHVVGNCQYTITPAREQLKLFSTIISVNQLSL